MQHVIKRGDMGVEIWELLLLILMIAPPVILGVLAYKVILSEDKAQEQFSKIPYVGHKFSIITIMGIMFYAGLIMFGLVFVLEKFAIRPLGLPENIRTTICLLAYYLVSIRKPRICKEPEPLCTE
jgi:hypothetical protein